MTMAERTAWYWKNEKGGTQGLLSVNGAGFLEVDPDDDYYSGVISQSDGRELAKRLLACQFCKRATVQLDHVLGREGVLQLHEAPMCGPFEAFLRNEWAEGELAPVTIGFQGLVRLDNGG